MARPEPMTAREVQRCSLFNSGNCMAYASPQESRDWYCAAARCERPPPPGGWPHPPTGEKPPMAKAPPPPTPPALRPPGDLSPRPPHPDLARGGSYSYPSEVQNMPPTPDAPPPPRFDIVLTIGNRVRVRYKNWRGETAERNVLIMSGPVWTSSDHHPEPQWLMWVVDLDIDESRLFAIKDMIPLDA